MLFLRPPSLILLLIKTSPYKVQGHLRIYYRSWMRKHGCPVEYLRLLLPPSVVEGPWNHATWYAVLLRSALMPSKGFNLTVCTLLMQMYNARSESDGEYYCLCVHSSGCTRSLYLLWRVYASTIVLLVLCTAYQGAVSLLQMSTLTLMLTLSWMGHLMLPRLNFYLKASLKHQVCEFKQLPML